MKKSMSCLLLLLIIFFHLSIITLAADTITATQILRDNDTLISTGGTFALGFFTSGQNSTANRYLGIWYNNLSPRTVVWVANRDTPLTVPSTLTISSPGTLLLLNSSDALIWSTNTTGAKNPIAQLLDSGNLVVRDDADDSPSFLWQSFDYPSDTLLPGMKLGRNLVTGKDWYLSSWKNIDDPSIGPFTYWLDIRGYPQFWGSNASVPWFRSGPWNGQRFSGNPSLNRNSIYKFDFVLSEEEIYYSYQLLNKSVISRFIINANGYVQRWTWVEGRGWVLYLSGPVEKCDTYAVCGPNGNCDVNISPMCECLDKFVARNEREWSLGDASKGCVRRVELNCNDEDDGFYKYSGVKLPDTQNSWFNESMNLRECEGNCLNNCNCTAYATLNITGQGSGCLHWFGDLIDIKKFTENGQDVYIRVASSELTTAVTTTPVRRSKKKTGLVVGLTVVGLSLMCITTIFFFFCTRRSRSRMMRRHHHHKCPKHQKGKLLQVFSQFHSKGAQRKDVELFNFITIDNATSSFSERNKLGEGGFGTVYKGTLEDGQDIAVKRLSKESNQGVEEFKNEVLCIARLQHRNLVKLMGCCIEGEEKMLIYEYMSNTSLDSFIFDKTLGRELNWPKRFDIINGVARGLLYLHQDSRLRIIHRDLKASNVLLDANLNPKISDFGMARCFRGDETEANTKRVVGTYGYMSPEYAVDGIFSIKSDVFSFGVLVLEIVSGKRNRGFSHPDHSHNLLGHAWLLLYKEDKSTLELLEESVKGGSSSSSSCNLFEVDRAIHVALLCVQQHPDDRPNMSSVVLMLGSTAPLPFPKQPGFFTERNLAEGGNSTSSKLPAAAFNSNEYTITMLEPR
ncbi:G-type lectin S-receptor-like serine/threonine-protein kinase At4g27290 [Impatiens glandulifera]|uniref:G-type lectin S-receptor-like serine/threonine-protein kinase At4g27290 n=1 Tax=Impatiens glandulifera TaxID=253017 RepID=UPI001FB0D76B|nr:G-type lectin S-receptor-like serine/threonine-protein kinase At4g27290 [Impatiens glandulifera]